MIRKALRHCSDEHHRKAQEEIRNSDFRTELKNVAWDHILNNNKETKS